MEEVYTPQELAGRWHISLDTMYDMIRQHRLRAFRIGRSLRIPAEEVARVEDGDDWAVRHER